VGSRGGAAQLAAVMRPLAGANSAQIAGPKRGLSRCARGNEIDPCLPASLSLMCWPRMDLPVPALPYRGRGAFVRSGLWVAAEGESLLSREDPAPARGAIWLEGGHSNAGRLPALGSAVARITSR
jgi:hypothetical protein